MHVFTLPNNVCCDIYLLHPGHTLTASLDFGS